MVKVNSFDELCLEGLKDIYDAEHQMGEALVTMAEAATSPRLREALNNHRRPAYGCYSHSGCPESRALRDGDIWDIADVL
ncbi:MAG: DUF892 family protein [Armatimonas sp.]